MSDSVDVEDVITWTPRVLKTIAQNLQKEPKRQLFYILLGPGSV